APRAWPGMVARAVMSPASPRSSASARSIRVAALARSAGPNCSGSSVVGISGSSPLLSSEGPGAARGFLATGGVDPGLGRGGLGRGGGPLGAAAPGGLDLDDPVAQGRRPLELEGLGGLEHLGLELVEELLVGVAHLIAADRLAGLV